MWHGSHPVPTYTVLFMSINEVVHGLWGSFSFPLTSYIVMFKVTFNPFSHECIKILYIKPTLNIVLPNAVISVKQLPRNTDEVHADVTCTVTNIFKGEHSL